ncbi:glycosyltransferase [Cryobacterium sp. Y82]|uniref:glycosyltransferase n=1 Tax=Cryobacterium sp. Y82 TaxID=2045017 RepID=UPI000CE30797|nr:glycosyltransferase [Cryobacterium sp. Y82]
MLSTDRKLRVLHLLRELNPSGMERMLVSAASDFSRLGVRGFVVGQGRKHPFADELQRAGYAVTLLNGPVTGRHSRRQLRKLVRQEQIDVIHVHTEGDYLRTVLACVAAFGSQRPCIVRTVHNVFDARGRWFLSRWIQAAVADRFVRAIIAPSPDVTANEHRFGRNTRTILNWVDDAFFAVGARRDAGARAPFTPLLGLLVGNCSAIKRHGLYLQAAIAAGHSVMHLGSEERSGDAERKFLNDLEASGQLFTRGVKSPVAALGRADYFAMPSSVEGMGVALAEAIVSGVPCLVSASPGLHWAHGIPGVVMVPDTPEAWQKAVLSPPTEAVVSPFDFTSARGASEYVGVYRTAVRP